MVLGFLFKNNQELKEELKEELKTELKEETKEEIKEEVKEELITSLAPPKLIRQNAIINKANINDVIYWKDYEENIKNIENDIYDLKTLINKNSIEISDLRTIFSLQNAVPITEEELKTKKLSPKQPIKTINKKKRKNKK